MDFLGFRFDTRARRQEDSNTSGRVPNVAPVTVTVVTVVVVVVVVVVSRLQNRYETVMNPLKFGRHLKGLFHITSKC